MRGKTKDNRSRETGVGSRETGVGSQETGVWSQECLAIDELAGDDRWWGIYRESFADKTREPASVILESLRRGVGMAFRARRGGVAVGIATTHHLVNPPAVFLVYLAVSSAYRGMGVGRELFEFAWSTSAARLREPLGMIWEVSPDPGTLAFFGRVGGVLLPRPYLQPAVNGVEPVPMRLMFRTAKGAALPDAAGIDALVEAMYIEKYGAVNGIYMK